jgi:hypothetical protein
MEFTYDRVTGTYELSTDNYLIRYEVTNQKVYAVEVHDNYLLESVSIFLSEEELFRIINNPRVAFYI